MKKKILLYYFVAAIAVFIFSKNSFSQNVGIGTTAPNAKAALEIKSTDKGVLFPRLTTAQRNAITNPPDGLHIYNKDERCLNYYDSLYQIWNCYCADCQAVIINITDDICNVDFYNQFAKYNPAKKYIINLNTDVYIYGCNPGDTALSFRNMPNGTSIIINNNYGFIIGAGGKGGKGQMEPGSGSCSIFFLPAEPGQAGGAAIVTKAGVMVTVNNYGQIAGGGGGGGGSNKGATSGYGGGGGGGAGLAFAPGGTGGGLFSQTCGTFGCGPCLPNYLSQAGASSTNITPGNGGLGYNGGPSGGNGGNRGQSGQNGNVAAGGAAGKAIGGGSGNIIINIGGGQSFGIVD
ncbi:hypothetical protein [Ferruginibacter sp.]